MGEAPPGVEQTASPTAALLEPSVRNAANPFLLFFFYGIRGRRDALCHGGGRASRSGDPVRSSAPVSAPSPSVVGSRAGCSRQDGGSRPPVMGNRLGRSSERSSRCPRPSGTERRRKTNETDSLGARLSLPVTPARDGSGVKGDAEPPGELSTEIHERRDIYLSPKQRDCRRSRRRGSPAQGEWMGLPDDGRGGRDRLQSHTPTAMVVAPRRPR